MKRTQTFLKFALTVITLVFGVHPVFAQVTYRSNNTATATANVGTVGVTDVSNNGAAVNRLAGDQTPINFPTIGVSNSVATPIIKADGSYDITYTFLVQNYGSINLKTVQVVNDLTTVFTSPLTYTIVSLTSTGSIAVNTGFNGNVDKNLLNTASSNLAVGANGTISLTVNVVPHATYGTFNSTVTASAVTNDASAVAVSDISTNNASPNHADGSKTPLNFNDPTPVSINSSDIQIVKTVNNLTPNTGDNITFTITATNLGAGTAAPVTVNDIVNTTGYTLVSATPSKGSYDTGTGVWSIGTLNVGASNAATLVIVATVLPDKPVSTNVNTASSNHPGDPVSANNSSTLNVVPVQVADLLISNTDNKNSYTPGGSNTYTVIATNNGPSNAAGSSITYTLPAGISGTWTAVYTGGATGSAGGTNNINETVNMPPGSKTTYTVITTIPSSQTGVFTTTATITAPTGLTDITPANNLATDNDVKIGDADLTITNTDAKSSYTPGVGNTYTIVATNNGPSDAAGTTVTYPLPGGITGTWTAVYSGGATGTGSGTNSINEIVNMPVGSTITYTLIATIPASFTGALTTTATITPVLNVIDPVTANNTATDIDIQNSVSELIITNTDGKVIYVPGINNTYTVVATNTGPSDAVGSTITFPLPAGITGSWTAVYTGGATGNASGTGDINETVNMPSGSTVTYTIIAAIPSAQTDAIITTVATVTAPAGTTDPTPANNTASDTDTRVGGADLSVTLTDGKTTYIPGTSTSYTLVATNNGPSDIANASVALPLPAGAVATWTATYNGGATGAASGSNSISQVVNMPSGSTATYIITGAIPSSKTGDLSFTATINLPAGSVDPTPANNTATDTDTQNSQADLTITNTDARASYAPGTNNTYTVVAKNTGPSDAPGSTITYTLPSGITGSWTAVYTGGASGAASGTNNINEVVNMPANGTVTYTIVAVIPSNQTGLFTTNAVIAVPSGINDPTTTNNTANDTDLKIGDADLSIVNTDNKAFYVPGTNSTYTIVASNTGPSDVLNATVTYPIPSGITASWTAVYNGGATGAANGTGSINQTVNIPVGGTVTYTLTAAIPSSQTGFITTTATIATPLGVVDPLPDNNTANDTDLRIGDADLSITNTDGQTNYTPGVGNTYTIVVNNDGPSNVTAATVTYPLPAGVTGTWTAVYTGGATGAANGTNSINATVNMPVGSKITYTVVTIIPSNTVGALTTTATITLPAGSVDPTTANNTASDTDTQNSISNLSINNTDSKIIFIPGTTNTYSVIASNTGPSDAPGTNIKYTLPIGVTGTWAATYTGGATGNANGINNIDQIVSMPAGSTVTYSITALIPAGQTGATLATAANITPAVGITDQSVTDNTANDTDIRIGGADLTITNTDNQTAYIPGISNTYTVVATNNGPSNVVNANVAYQLPTGATATWTAVYTGGATGNGNGVNRANQLVSMPIGSTITYTVIVSIPSGTTGDFSTTTTISLPAGSLDPTPDNNSATDTDTQNSYADLSITNTDGKAVYTPGTTNTYTIVATNNGPSDATGSKVMYTLPVGITGTWTAVYSGGATGNTSGTNNINQTVNMPAGSSVVYTLIATVPSNQTGVFVTSAVITPATGITDPTPGNNTAGDTDLRSSQADLAITNTDGQVTYVPGTTNTYTIVATNNGPSDAVSATISYPVPTGTTITWTADYTGGATGTANGTGSITETVNMPAGSTITYTVTATIPSSRTGTLTTTATINTPVGITDPTPANNTANDIDLQNNQADLSISNTDGKLIYNPGTSNTYTIVATNTGPSDAPNSNITYTLPSGITGTWTADYVGGASGNASGTNGINELVNLPVGGTVTYTLIANVPSSQTGAVTTTANITAGTGVADQTPDNNTATDNDLKVGDFDLSITNKDGKATYVPGTTNTYTLVATNSGPSDVVGAGVTYPTPTGTTITWTAVYNGGATGNTGGNGSINETVNMPAGSTITYAVIATIPSSRTGVLSTTATIAPQVGFTDPVSSNNTANDVDVQSSQADLGITNTDGKVVYTPGVANTYTVVATNNGPSDVTGATVIYNLPAGITGTWTAVYAGGATGNAIGTNNVNETVTMPAGSTITYTVIASVPSGQTDPFSTTANITVPTGVTDPVPDNNTATDNDVKLGQFDLSITNTDAKLTYIPGTTNTYKVVATNSGPSDITGAKITYPTPSGGVTFAWTAVYATGATGNATGTGSINETVNMPAGSTVTYTVIATIPSNRTGAITTTANIASPLGFTDPVSTNNTATDIDTQNSQVEFSITNTDAKLIYNPGTTNTYTLVATNTGPSDAVGSRVTYTSSAAGLTATWTAVYTGGATGNANGTNSINELVNIPVGGTVTYTVIVNISSAQTGTITTTASIAPAAGITDLTPANNVANDTDFKVGDFDLGITNTDSKTAYVPGTTNTYTVVATNSGPSDVVGATITYPAPTGVTITWAAVFTGGATGNASGTGSINETVNMPAGAKITYTVIATILGSQTGTVTTVATIQPTISLTDPIQANNTATDIDTQNSQADLGITNTDGKTVYVPGTNNTYVIVAANNGPSNVTGAKVTYTLPAGITGNWTAVYAGGATGNASGTNNINETVNMPAGSTITCTLIATVPAAYTGSITTVAGIAVPTGVTDLITANNTATDVDGQNSATDLKVVKTVSDPAPYVNSQVTFTIAAGNNGPSAATNVSVTDLLPSGLTYVSSVASIGTYVSNTGVWTIGNLSGSGSATITITAKVNATGNYTNIATITGAETDGDLSNNSSQVTITPKQLPLANNDAATTNPNTPVIISILTNDVKGFANLDPASVTIIQQPAHGTVTINNSTGVATYNPATNYYGTDLFTYTVKDINGQVSNVATVNININDLPVIGLAKSVVNSVKNINGSYDITYLLTVGDYGVTDLSDISIKDDLSQTFRGEQMQVKSITSLGKLKVNASYDGKGIVEMLQTGNVLLKNQIEQIQVVVNVLVLDGVTLFNNSATAQGISVTTLKATDQSTDGLKPDPTTAGDVSPSIPTPVQLGKPMLHIPAGFSPNGDGTHDSFVIEGAGSSIVNFEIYNRWGNLVYRDPNYKNDWTGKCNQGVHLGDNLPAGTYYYIIKLDDKDRYVGYLTLNR